MHILRAFVCPPPCDNNAKLPKFDGNDTCCCPDAGVVCIRSEKTLRAN